MGNTKDRINKKVINTMEIQQPRQVGLITLKQSRHLTPIQRQMVTRPNNRVMFDWGDYERHSWHQIMPKIAKIQASQFWIWNNNRPAIIKQIEHVSLPNLLKLVLCRNHIQSLEAIGRHNFPVLVELDLSCNEITNAKSIIRTTAPALKQINLQQNPLIHKDELFKTHFQFLEEIKLSSEVDIHEKFGIKADPVIWMIKMKRKLRVENRYDQDGCYINYFQMHRQRHQQ